MEDYVKTNKEPIPEVVLSRGEYQEILLAKLAGGDMYANETRLKLRKVDMQLDVFREVPLYKRSKWNASYSHEPDAVD